MALTEETLQDKIEIVGDYKHVQVRTATVIKRDGTEISRGYSRHVVAPDAEIHDIYTHLAKSRAYWRTWISCSCWNL